MQGNALPVNPDSPSPIPDDSALREALKRCSATTYDAACRFRQHGHPDDLRLVVAGVIERYVERAQRATLAGGADSLRLREDLGLDSLTMMEIVMLAEEILPLSVGNDELTQLRTVGDVQALVARKVSPARSGVEAPAAS